MNITILGNHAYIRVNYNSPHFNFVKKQPFLTFDRSTKCYVVFLDNYGLDLVMKLLGQGFFLMNLDVYKATKENCDKRTLYLKQIKAQQKNIIPNGKIPISETIELYDFQYHVVNLMITGKRILNNSFTGSGKTVQSIAWLDLIESDRNLIIVPKPVLYQWLSEIQKFTPDNKVVLINGEKKARQLAYDTFDEIREPKTLITTYELFRQDYELYFKNNTKAFDTIICDEAQRIVNHSSQTYKCLRKMQSEYMLLLTATPLMNRITDCYGLFNLLAPSLFGTFTGFLERYTERDYFGMVKGYKQDKIDELKSKIEPFIVGVALKDSGIELPPVTETDIVFDLSDKEKKLYKHLKAEMVLEIKESDISKVSESVKNNLAQSKLIRLQQLVNFPEILGEMKEKSKFDTMIELLSDKLQSEDKAVIISEHAEACKLIMKYLPQGSAVIITGQDSDKVRKERLDQFINSPSVKYLVGTRAISTGLNLQNASVLVNFDQPWSVGQKVQRTGRIHRIGQDKNVFVYNLLGKNTVDFHVKKLLSQKQELADQIQRLSYGEMRELILSEPF